MLLYIEDPYAEKGVGGLYGIVRLSRTISSRGLLAVQQHPLGSNLWFNSLIGLCALYNFLYTLCKMAQMQVRRIVMKTIVLLR